MSPEAPEQYAATKIQRVAGLILPCYAYFSIMGIPLIFNAIITRFGVDSPTATIATTAEIGCISIATLFVSLILGRLKPRQTMVLAVFLVLIGEAVTLATDHYGLVVVARALAGIGKGLCIGLGLASLAQMKGGMKFLSYVGGLTAVITWLGFLVVPAMEEHIGSSAVFLFNIGMGIIAIPLAFAMPKMKVAKLMSTNFTSRTLLQPRSLAVFTLCLFSSIGASSCWLYLQQVGESNGLTPAGVGLVGSVATLLSVVAPFIATYIFARLKSVWPMLLTCAGLGVCSQEYVHTSVLGFWIIVIVMSVLYLFLMAYARMYSAYVDRSGRSTAAVGAADALGLLIGPVFAATFISLEHGYMPLGNMGSVLQFMSIIPVVILFVCTRKSISGDLAEAD
jgi:predicted MFS family arabinose efflux permease